jgi:hypothetical protein
MMVLAWYNYIQVCNNFARVQTSLICACINFEETEANDMHIAHIIKPSKARSSKKVGIQQKGYQAFQRLRIPCSLDVA